MARPVLYNLKDLNQLHEDPGKGFEFFSIADKFSLNAVKEYSSITAWWCAEFARLSYVKDVERIKKECEDVGFSLRFFYVDDTEAHIAWNDTHIICFFRGTQPNQIADIITDLRFFKKQSNTYGQVHGGFKDSLDEVWDDMEDLLQELDDGKRRFLFTGHSLGASLATLASSRWKHSAITYTFGSPRCGDKKFATQFDIVNSHHRFTNDNDIVPHVPPRFIGFMHTGKQHAIDYKKAFDYEDDGTSLRFRTWIMKIIAKFVKIWIRSITAGILIIARKLLIDKVTDHSMAHYSKFLENHLRMMIRG